MPRKSVWEKKYEAEHAAYLDLSNRKMEIVNEKLTEIEMLRAELEKARHLLKESQQALSLYMMSRAQLASTSGNVNAFLARGTKPPEPQRF